MLRFSYRFKPTSAAPAFLILAMSVSLFSAPLTLKLIPPQHPPMQQTGPVKHKQIEARETLL